MFLSRYKFIKYILLIDVDLYKGKLSTNSNQIIHKPSNQFLVLKVKCQRKSSSIRPNILTILFILIKSIFMVKFYIHLVKIPIYIY
jgi:hypothetical protein